mmetsp:Transcript_29505/g.56677  ORF Transcript_29505/g.56677 Transcript_29505/m.56677 type:complete len:312 (+) Transcript_29505:204-1139(+)
MAVKRVGLIAVLSSFFLALLGIPNSLPVTNAAWNNDEEVYAAELLRNGSLSVLSRFKSKGKIFHQPYTYLVVSEALEPSIYARLAKSFPSDTDILKLNGETERRQNFRYDVQGRLLLDEQNRNLVSPLWRAFTEYHTSRAFFDEVDSLLKKDIRAAHPGLKSKLNTGLRHNDSTADVLLDCQVAINTPVRARSAVRGPHLDGPGELWAGLLYLRHEADQASTGGELQVLECKAPKCSKMSRKDRLLYGTGDTHYRPSDVWVRNQVPYKANSFALFVNSNKAIHGVTPRSVTHFSRRIVNIVAVRQGVGKLG